MDIIKLVNDNIDPFLMQLVIIPTISIYGGVFISFKTRKFLIAPVFAFLVSNIYSTVFLNMCRWQINYWDIILPAAALIISCIFKALMPADN